jgi:hypothetical protein
MVDRCDAADAAAAGLVELGVKAHHGEQVLALMIGSGSMLPMMARMSSGLSHSRSCSS